MDMDPTNFSVLSCLKQEGQESTVSGVSWNLKNEINNTLILTGKVSYGWAKITQLLIVCATL